MINDLDNRFDFHSALNDETKELHTTIREACRLAAKTIVGITPESREQSLAITALEEAMFWGNAAIARNK